jgi:hypothetical protein
MALVLAGIGIAAPARGDDFAATPAADGEALDMPADGVFDSIDTTSAGITVQSTAGGTPTTRRGVFEFDIRAVPKGAAVQSASFQVRVYSGTAPSRFDLYGYQGDGVVDLSDATRGDTQVATLVWSTLPASATFDVTGYVQSLVSSGVPFLGLNLRALEVGQNYSVTVGALESSPPPQLTVTYSTSGPPVPPQDWRLLPLLADGTASDVPTDGVFDSVDTVSNTLTAQSTAGSQQTPQTRRAILEFDASGLASSASVQSATLVLQSSMLKRGGTPAVFDLHGYAGDGVVSLADATAGGPVLSSVSLTTTGIIRMDATSFLGGLRAANGAIAGFNLRDTNEGSSPGGRDELVQVGSAESLSPLAAPPPLEVVSSIAPAPTPAMPPGYDVAMAGLLALGGLSASRAHRQRGPGVERMSHTWRRLP